MENHTVTILPNNRKIEVEPGGNLLSVLVENSIFLRSDCGGRGVCGKCRIDVSTEQNQLKTQMACTFTVLEDVSIEIPPTSMLSSHIIQKAVATLPESFLKSFQDVPNAASPAYGIAIDLGTTTLALYLCNMTKGAVLSSLALKNPQALYGDDVMSRIGVANQKVGNLEHLQKLVVKTIEWGCEKLAGAQEIELKQLEKMVVVGNPTMIHLFLGVDPRSIGVAPYQPAFFEARCVDSSSLGFEKMPLRVHTLPQISGFIGGDILAATLATELSAQPTGTLVVDIGTNGELVYKGQNGIYATSCATGPAFEGASISCGMQAIPGAIEKVTIADRYSTPQLAVIKKNNSKDVNPTGLCGSGVISVAAELFRSGIVKASGAFVEDTEIRALSAPTNNGKRYVLSQSDSAIKADEVAISQKDIRSIQLGKAALITGIEFLLLKEKTQLPKKIIVAGAFGSYLEKDDMITLGMLPKMELQEIINSGNLAGAGAVMALCDERYLEQAKNLAAEIQIVDLASSPELQKVFVDRLAFPEHAAGGL
jgi:uncharacterized 2Fe-2S/4Fe-4S cluster protein (DUF4445 family)